MLWIFLFCFGGLKLLQQRRWSCDTAPIVHYAYIPDIICGSVVQWLTCWTANPSATSLIAITTITIITTDFQIPWGHMEMGHLLYLVHNPSNNEMTNKPQRYFPEAMGGNHNYLITGIMLGGWHGQSRFVCDNLISNQIHTIPIRIRVALYLTSSQRHKVKNDAHINTKHVIPIHPVSNKEDILFTSDKTCLDIRYIKYITVYPCLN